MSIEFRRRGKNWFTAMGVLFIIMGLIVIARNLIIWGPEFVLDFLLNSEARNLIIWGPDFVLDFLLNSEITNEKISFGMFAFGGFMIILGFRKYD